MRIFAKRTRAQLITALEVINPAGEHSRNRIFEWLMSGAMIGIAVACIATPDTIKDGSFRLLVEVGLDAGAMAIFFMAFGITRMVALWTNGTFPALQPWGAKARALGAGAAAMLWSQMILALAMLSETTGTISIGVPVYAALTVGELISCYRAAADEIRRIPAS